MRHILIKAEHYKSTSHNNVSSRRIVRRQLVFTNIQRVVLLVELLMELNDMLRTTDHMNGVIAISHHLTT